MKTLLAVLCTVWLTVVATPAMAVEINITDVTCEDGLQLDAEIIDDLLIWMDGYLSAKEGFVIYSTEEVATLREAMGSYCQEMPEATLLEALRESE